MRLLKGVISQLRGLVRYYAVFDGVDNNITVVHSSSIDTSTGSFTITAWVRTKSYPTASTSYILGKGVNGPGFYIGIDGKYRLGISNSSVAYYIQSTNAVTLNIWDHLAIVYNHDTNIMEAYINGVLRDTKTIEAPAQTINTSNMILGSTTTATKAASDTDVSTVRFWKDELTQAEIIDDMNMNRRTLNLGLELPMVGGATDTSGNNNTVTIAGGTTFASEPIN